MFTISFDSDSHRSSALARPEMIAAESAEVGDIETIPAVGSSSPHIVYGNKPASSYTIEEAPAKSYLPWDSSASKRFKELAVLKALSKASQEQLDELKDLSVRRRVSQIKLDPEVIIFEIRHKRAVDELSRFLEHNSAVIGSVSKGSSPARAAEKHAQA